MFNYHIELDLYKYTDYAGNTREALEVDLEEFCHITHAFMGVKRDGRYELVYYWHGVTRYNIDDDSIRYYKRLISIDEYKRFLIALEG